MAYCDDLGPVVLPVNYVTDHDTILIQISPHSTLARTCGPRPRRSRSTTSTTTTSRGGACWSAGTPLTSTALTFRGDDDRPVAWAEGQRTFYVRITPHDISGRRLLPA